MLERIRHKMELLKRRILDEGRIIGGQIIKVDSFLNHQMDIELFNEMGREFKKRFEDKEITKILTVEASGIGIACITAQYFHVPVVFAKKNVAGNLDKDTYESEVYSFTKGRTYTIRVAKSYLQKEDKVLIIDDFLAKGHALQGLLEIVEKAGGEVAGIGIVIEKGFQEGRLILKDKNIRLESLVIIDSIKGGRPKFR